MALSSIGEISSLLFLCFYSNKLIIKQKKAWHVNSLWGMKNPNQMKKTSIIPEYKLESEKATFEIQTIEWAKENIEERISHAHSHDHYEMVWITKGPGMISLDMQHYEFDGHQLFLIRPGQVHLIAASGDVEGFIFSFTDSFLSLGEHEFDWTCQSSLFQLFAMSRMVHIADESKDDMEEISSKMMKESNNQYAFKQQVLKRYFKIFLIYLSRQFELVSQATHQSRNAELVESFLQLLEKNFKQKKMVSEYAWQLSVTPNYLNEIVKKITGYSAGHHIRQRVVLEAKRMGLYSAVCMKEVAYSLGFNDSAHFSKFFKSVSGTNFSDFKKKKRSISLTA